MKNLVLLLLLGFFTITSCDVDRDELFSPELWTCQEAQTELREEFQVQFELLVEERDSFEAFSRDWYIVNDKIILAANEYLEQLEEIQGTYCN